MLRRLYQWVLSLAGHRHAVPVLGLISFLESSIFPIPPDVMLAPMILARRAQAFRLAALCTATSVLGGCAGYAIGYFLWETIGQGVIQAYGLAGEMAVFQQAFQEYGWWIVVIKGMTPIPYKLITIASGVAKFDLLSFIGASVLSRALRFFLVGALLWRFGEPVRDFVERYLTLVTTLFVILLLGGFAILRYV